MLVGCGPIRLVSAYDQVVDEGVTKFHTDIVAFVGKMSALAGKPEGTYEANQGAYAEFAAQLSSLKMHAAQTPKNTITEQALDELARNIENLRKLHESGKDHGLSEPLTRTAIVAIHVQCESILKFEMAKKRGEDKQ